MKKVCCAFGHRIVTDNIEEKLYAAVMDAINSGCDIFYTGYMGDFDKIFCSTVNKIKRDFTHIKLICVKPYFTNTLNVNRQFYESFFDDVVIPDELIQKHYKGAITARNRWMIKQSDIVVVYSIRNYGGAFDALQYAKRSNKNIIIL